MAYSASNFDDKKLQQLAKNKQWQALIFYKRGKAEVISPKFYLSNAKNLTPYNELVATLNQANKQKIICRYPARYYWLQHQLQNFQVDFSSCKNLPNPKNDISLIQVSSYLKNPASSFGHVLIKTNDNNQSAKSNKVKSLSSEDLLSQSYNFGAKIPDKENDVLYALKGLFGFYDAGFSQADFFKQDAVYSKTEQRDMWEFVLNLDEFQRTLLNYHLYEVQNARFKYYFIKQNCAYRSGELLELVSDVKTTEHLGSWYAPDYVFDQLVEFKDKNNNSLVKSVHYLPSEQTQLKQKFNQLPNKLQKVINQFIKSEKFDSINSSENNQQALVLDYLISHRNYKISQASKEKEKQQHYLIKKQLISKRFSLPMSNEFNQLPLLAKPSPAFSNKTSKNFVNMGNHGFKSGASVFIKDPLNKDLAINKRFEALKLSADYKFYDKQEDGLLFDEFVILDMQQIEDINNTLVGEPTTSWQLATGIERDPLTEEKLLPYVKVGIGKGLSLNKENQPVKIMSYGFLNAYLHNQKNYIDLSGQLGMRIKHDKKNRAGELEYIVRTRKGAKATQKSTLTLRQGINKNNDVRVITSYTDNPNIEEKHKKDIQLEYNHYW